MSRYLDLIARAQGSDRRALGRLLSLVENDPAEGSAILAHLSVDGLPYQVTGVTGAPGVGKSTLVDQMVVRWLAAGRHVAVVAVDPSSPFTQGALLGDRVRMSSPANSDYLMRSMASRGFQGGVARSTMRVVAACGLLGYEEVIVETVGVGQSEVDVAFMAHTTVVVTMPATGDDVQAAKAGVTEAGDVFVVNKAELVGADQMVAALESALAFGSGEWLPPVVTASAAQGRGVGELLDAIEGHRSQLATSQKSLVGKRRLSEFVLAVRDAVQVQVDSILESIEGQRLSGDVETGRCDPWTAAAELVTGARLGVRQPKVNL